MIQKMASKISRESRGGRPIRLGTGNRSAIKTHCVSDTRCRGILAPHELVNSLDFYSFDANWILLLGDFSDSA